MCVGGAVFAYLAIVDYRRHGRAATRWREYCFLLACAVGAMAYGAVNDQITSRISWEYFYYGKELFNVLGPVLPPDPGALHWEAMKIGMQATWTVGLLLGAVMLIANNPQPMRPSLTYRKLFRRLPIVIALAAGLAALGGLLGAIGWLNWQADFRDLWHAEIFRPPHFMAAWGIHLGGYLGGLIGGVVVMISIRRERARGQQS